MVFRDEWGDFVESINQIVEAKGNYGNLDAQQTIDTVGEIRDDLLQQDALTRMEYEVSELDRTTKAHLEQELEQWNTAAQSMFSAGTPSEDDMDSLLDDAQTVKDSIEQNLSLPNWMNRLLSILNEILNLIT
jgi:hypothetical protein